MGWFVWKQWCSSSRTSPRRQGGIVDFYRNHRVEHTTCTHIAPWGPPCLPQVPTPPRYFAFASGPKARCARSTQAHCVKSSCPPPLAQPPYDQNIRYARPALQHRTHRNTASPLNRRARLPSTTIDCGRVGRTPHLGLLEDPSSPCAPNPKLWEEREGHEGSEPAQQVFPVVPDVSRGATAAKRREDGAKQPTHAPKRLLVHLSFLLRSTSPSVWTTGSAVRRGAAVAAVAETRPPFHRWADVNPLSVERCGCWLTAPLGLCFRLSIHTSYRAGRQRSRAQNVLVEQATRCPAHRRVASHRACNAAASAQGGFGPHFQGSSLRWMPRPTFLVQSQRRRVAYSR